MNCLRFIDRFNRPVVSYEPYNGKVHPKFANFKDSIEKSPLTFDYTRHSSLTWKILKEIKRRRSVTWTWKTLSKIQREEWFIRIEERFHDYILAFESGRIPASRKLIAEAIMEVYCSLIIFSDHAYYRNMTEEDVLSLRFPLSQQSRLILHRGTVKKGVYDKDGVKLEKDTLKFSIRAF